MDGRYAKAVWPDGRLFTNTHVDAAQEDTYVLRGSVPEIHEPRFTCHGFRYVEVSCFFRNAHTRHADRLRGAF